MVNGERQLSHSPFTVNNSPFSIQMSDSRKKLGAWGEEVAKTHLEANGYKIINQNWRCRLGEIDIIAQKDGIVSFTEVKTRRSRAAGSPEESITPSPRFPASLHERGSKQQVLRQILADFLRVAE